MDFEGASYECVRGSKEISECVELVPTPGHTPGHQSVIVRAGGAIRCVVAQAAYTAAEYDAFDRGVGELSEGHWDPAAYRSSLEQIRAYAPDEAYFSHDASVWRRQR